MALRPDTVFPLLLVVSWVEAARRSQMHPYEWHVRDCEAYIKEVVREHRSNKKRYQTRKACEEAGIEFRGEHVFRHTFATNCYHKGIDVKILSRLLGHADVNITYNLYIHLYGDGFDEIYSALCK